MNLKLKFRNSRARERACAEPNFEVRLPFLTTNQTWGTLTNSGHTMWTLFIFKIYVPWQPISLPTTSHPLGNKIWRHVRRTSCLTYAPAHVCRAEFQVPRAFSANNSNLATELLIFRTFELKSGWNYLSSVYLPQETPWWSPSWHD